MKDKQALTTGEVAKHCGVNFRTVIRWIERGHLEAYKLPGRGDNRIPVDGFIAFLQSNQMPVPAELVQTVPTLLLLCEQNGHSSELAALIRKAGWEPLITHNAVAFGFQLAQQQPQAILLLSSTASEAVQRLLIEQGKNNLLLIALNAPAHSPCPEAWHCLTWPDGQNKLFDLLKGA